ncbi:MAG: alanine--tRNA ligase [Caldilineaceae bacterium]|nr:alanine--tRNA ligase [Caldilineaceae bacterium]
MKRLSTNEIRQFWLEYFRDKGHTVVESSSLVPAGDPTLMFTNAGMVQFKDVFTGAERRAYSRAVTSQKCLRVSGKHNDLENVGPSPRHHTFFEMLGNFSFGDYFKRDAIRYAWDLLVNEWGLPLERLWFSVYEDDEEAERLWIETGAAPDRVLRFGKKDNWWAMGDTGPCGPCSEIHFYWGDLAQQTPDGVNKDDEYLEIWNLVFMQYDQKPTGELVPLPAPSVDTGMGLERVASILQGKDNNYDADTFAPIMQRIQQLLEEDDEHRQANLAYYRAIADHSRAVSFLIADGILPGNEGRSYVLRMILRRAARFGKLLGFPGPFLAQIADVVIEQMGGHYTDLPKKRNFILQTITDEEERFHRTLSTGLTLLDELMERLKATGSTVIPGDEAFHLWDTYGFPIDLTNDVAAEAGFTVDETGFRVALAEQKEKSRASALDKGVQDVGLYADLLRNLQSQGIVDSTGVKQRIYENLSELDTTVAAIIRNYAGGDDAMRETISEAQAGEEVEIVLPETPFYVESGGQVSDTGEIYYFPEDVDQPAWTVEIRDTRRRVPGLITHIGKVTSGTVRVGDPALAVIDTERRWDIMRNHTATHVLHAVLRERLGDHVHQAGSLVEPNRLRFDFTHTQPVRDEELAEMERRANALVLDNYPVNIRWTSHARAVEEGAMALFGEKYGDEVRVVSFGEDEGISMELCGGTHVDSTAEIGGFRITSESSVAAGVRRIEVVTGRVAEEITEKRWQLVDEVADLLHAKPDELKNAAQQLLTQNQQLQKEIAQLRQKLAQQNSASLLDKAVKVNDVTVLTTPLDAADVDTLRQMTDWLRDKLGSAVVVVGAVIGDKPQLVAAVTPDLVSRGMHAGNLLREAAKVMGGGGGGRPDMAQAGGKDAAKLEDALATVPTWVKTNLK